MLSMETPTTITPATPAAAGPPKDFQYRNIKAKYFQSLNLAGDGSKSNSLSNNQPPVKPVHAAQHRRARSKTFSAPDTEILRTPAMEISSSGGGGRDALKTSGGGIRTSGAPSSQAAGDYFVPFAMSLPVHAPPPSLGQSVMPFSVMPRHSLADRDVDDDLNAELDDALEESFGATKPISIPAGSSSATTAAEPFFADDDEAADLVLAGTLTKAAMKPNYEFEQRRKEAKIRTLALGAD